METQLHFKDDVAFWKNRRLGRIIQSKSAFRSVKRTEHNRFLMFNGLGLNRQLLNILYRLGIKGIQVPYSGELLETTTEKWLTKGIPLPQQYCSNNVDAQLILPMNLINFDEDIPVNAAAGNMQLSLFGGA